MEGQNDKQALFASIYKLTMAGHLSSSVFDRLFWKSNSQYLHLESMAKTLSIAVLMMFLLSLLPSCRKCYTCVNSCSVCSLDSAGVAINTRYLYSDSLYYLAKKDSLTTAGYTCVKAPSTYKDDFCVNTKDAVDQYLVYHEGNGRYTCSPK